MKKKNIAEISQGELKKELESLRHEVINLKKDKEKLIGIEKNLKNSENRFKIFSEMTFEAILISENGIIVDANEVAVKMSGYPYQELIGKNGTELVIDEDKHIVKKNMISGYDQPYYVCALRKDGTKYDVEILGRTFKKNGKTSRVAVIRDITERKQIEKKIIESEQKFKAFTNQATDGVTVADTDGNYVFVNPAFCKMSGYTEKELLNKTIFDMKTKDQPTVFFNNRKKNEGVPLEINLLRKDKTEYSTEFIGKMIKVGKKDLVLGIVRDITNRKISEQELFFAKEKAEENEKRFKALHDASFGGIAIHDKGFILDCNKGLSEISGYSQDELIGMDGLLLISDSTRDTVLANIKSHYQKPYEAVGVRKNGEKYPLRLEAREIPYKGKQVRVVEFRDITDLKIAESELKKSEKLLRKIAENFPNSYVAIIEKDYTVGFTSGQELKKMDLDPDMFIGLSLEKVFGDKTPIVYKHYKKTFEGSEQSFELFINDQFQLYRTVPLIEEDGSINSILSVVENITEKKKEETEKTKLQEQVLQSQKMRSITTLAGGIAHQFNNALTGIVGNIDLLEMDFENNNDVIKYTDRMKDSSKWMAKLTNQLLAYARGGKYREKNISGFDLIKDTLSLIEHSINKDIDFDTEIPDQVLYVKADITQIQMVLSAIISNASEAIDGNGSITVKCRKELISEKKLQKLPDLKPGEYLCINIEDNGRGMDSDTRDRIFEPFFTTNFTGRGLGMAAAFGIISNHNGLITVDSELGSGTTVSVYLPVVEVAEKVFEKPQNKLIKENGDFTILIIEDEEMVRKMIETQLDALGYRTLSVENGKDAVELIKTFDGDIDLAILDLILPDMVGLEVFKQIIKIRSSLKVIVCSGYSIDGPAREIIDEGADGFIQKPFRLTDLSEILQKYLNI